MLAEVGHYGSGLSFTPPARAVVRPFGWRTLNVPGEGMVCGPPYPELLNRRTGKRRGQVYVGPRFEPGRGGDPSVTHPWGPPPPRPWFPRGPAGSTPGAGSCHEACRVGSWARPEPKDPSPRSPRWWVHLILVQILRLLHYSIHLRFRPIYIYKILNDYLCGTDATNKKRIGEKIYTPLINPLGLIVLIFLVVVIQSVYIMVMLYQLMTNLTQAQEMPIITPFETG